MLNLNDVFYQHISGDNSSQMVGKISLLSSDELLLCDKTAMHSY